MPIRILEKPEPLSEASRANEKPVLIGSEALDLLEHELRRYCNQEVNGRSFLIAGHRGSGKTTLVYGAFQRVLEEMGDGDARQLRPLLVLLQGPNLLPSPEETNASVAKADGDAVAKDPRVSEMENVLIHITLGLYRSLAQEFTGCFRRVQGLFDKYLEFPAQFELELDQYPGLARLREYWRRAGCLYGGVLFPERPLPDAYIRSGRWRVRSREDQGVRELVALSSACEAYQRISGTINRKEQTKEAGETKTEAQIALNAKGSELFKPLIALLTGGVAGTGMLAANQAAPVTAVLTGLVAALAASIALKYSSSWSRQRSLTREDLFMPNLSIGTLDRVLPVLIKRIREAGLAPVFVVDELDKVVGLSERITEMVRRLKKFVAENAFFCFLTDRSYFEEMRERTSDAPYPIEYTYFTNQVFVVAKHQDLHQYLQQVLEAPAVARVEEDAAAGQSSAYREAADREAAEYTTDSVVLPYLLLYASQMHPIDIRRQLAVVRGTKGEVSLAPGAVRSRPRYRFELMIQVAIEIVLEEDDMQAELDRQPAFLRLAHDAMYYIPRRWRNAPDLLLLEHEGERDFEAYLRDRMRTSAPPSQSPESFSLTNSTSSLTDSTTQPSAVSRPLRGVDPAQRRFLMGCVRDLASLLSFPSILRQRGRAKREPVPQVVLDAIPAEALLHPVEGLNNVYRWHVHPSARPIVSESPEEKWSSRLVDEKEWKDNADFIDAFVQSLSDITHASIDPSTLSSQLGIVRTTPAWADVNRALARLRSAQSRGVAYPEQEPDVSVVDAYAALLKSSAETVALALVCGYALGHLQPQSEVLGALPGLKVISRTLWLRDKAADHVVASLRNLAYQMTLKFGAATPLGDPPALSSRENLPIWVDWITRASKSLVEEIGKFVDVFEESQRLSWESWFERLQGRVAQDFNPEISDMICSVARIGPALYLRTELNLMDLGDWTKALLAAIVSRDPKASDYAPPWLVLEAFEQLGFEKQAVNLAEYLREKHTPHVVFGDRTMAEDETRDFLRWRPHRGQGGSRRSALIFSKSPKAVIARERPSERYAVMALGFDNPTKKVQEIWAPSAKEIIKFLDSPLIAVEMPAVQHDDRYLSPTNGLSNEEEALVRFFRSKSDSEQPVYLAFPKPWGGYLDSHYCEITAKNLKELFSEAEASVAPKPSPQWLR
jgi:hypothetical protein